MSWVPSVISQRWCRRAPARSRIGSSLARRVARPVGVGELEGDDGEARDLRVEARARR